MSKTARQPTRKKNHKGRSSQATSGSDKTLVKRVLKRDGSLVEFDLQKIVDAVWKGMQAAEEGSHEEAKLIANKVYADLIRITKRYKTFVPSVEGIQDTVEKELILSDYVKTAKAYILYREERAKVRARQVQIPQKVREKIEESKKYFKGPYQEFIFYRTYSRWHDELGRRETWVEAIDRFIDFMKENLGEKISDKEYKEVREAMLNQEVCPSMRLLWSAGKAARATNVCAYNCAYIAPTSWRDLAEIMYVSMCGTGAGFSVEPENVEKFPQIQKQKQGAAPKKIVVADSKEGWCGAFIEACEAWTAGYEVDLDYSNIRPSGARLKTMGGRASGPKPLEDLMQFTRKKILSRQGRRLSTLDVHDIACQIGLIVVAGGVRRSALISLSALDDIEMRDAKKGAFWQTNGQRSMANNSAVYEAKPSAGEFLDEWTALVKSGTGERGIFNRSGLQAQLPKRRWEAVKDQKQMGVNPCITGDTLVYTADGRGNVPIKQLAEEGKDVPVFCLNDAGKVVVRVMRNPRLTGRNKGIYKVTLDDGSTIRTTANHKFRLKSGEYRAVSDLKRGDSLHILTRFEASIKDMFKEPNKRSQDYWWINNGQRANAGEHRMIAAFHQNTRIPRGYVVHHRDRDAQNNHPDNLEILSKEAHDTLHARLMEGDNNPMRRAKDEWSEERWNEYRFRHSENNSGENNTQFSGITHDQLRAHALTLTKKLGRRFSAGDWVSYAKKHNLPQSLSLWRQNHLGGMKGFAKWAAFTLGLEYIDQDPRVVKSYEKYTSEGYDCDIIEGSLVIQKHCEQCGDLFRVDASRREQGMCSIECGVKEAWDREEFRKKVLSRIHEVHDRKRIDMREKQIEVYSQLAFQLGREPLKREWKKACKKSGISAEIPRSSSPFRTYAQLQARAETWNHKVVSVERSGSENVFNGTVDEYHNFFVGGFEGHTRNGKRKMVYLNNLNCGEIYLRSKQFCNLTSIVIRPDDDSPSLKRKMRLATLLGTYQASLTNFKYLSPGWKKNSEEEALLGVSLTGYYDNDMVRNDEMLDELRKEAIKANKKYAKKIGINESTAITTVKPHGNSGQLLGVGSGMHPWFARYFLRRVRVSANDPLLKLAEAQGIPVHPEVGYSTSNASTMVLEFPVKAPEGAVVKDDVSALDLLHEWRRIKKNYTEHNPSATIYVSDNEWIEVANFIYENWEIIGGLSFLPRNDHVYQLAPYEEIDQKEYEKRMKEIGEINFVELLRYENTDNTTGAKELACVSGDCEI